MMTDFPAFSTFSFQLLILLTVIVCKSVISHFIPHEPLKAFRFYCLQLSNKVNKRENSAKQQTIAGFIALLITIVPIAVILWLFESFIEVNLLWQFLLLYLALGSFTLSQTNKSIAQAVIAKQNYVAKQTLKPWVLRETDALSSLGLSKAAIEMKLLRTLQQGYTVAVLFMIFGPLAALCYRLILEMHYCWNIKLDKFIYFGQSSNLIVTWLQWLPVRVFSLLLLFTCVGKNVVLFWRLSKKFFFHSSSNIALSLFALSLEVKLGGVAMYLNTSNHPVKLRKTAFNDIARQPQATDIIHANHKISLINTLSIILLIFFAVLSQLIVINR